MFNSEALSIKKEYVEFSSTFRSEERKLYCCFLISLLRIPTEKLNSSVFILFHHMERKTYQSLREK